jgi:hypothetical protein
MMLAGITESGLYSAAYFPRSSCGSHAINQAPDESEGPQRSQHFLDRVRADLAKLDCRVLRIETLLNV